MAIIANHTIVNDYNKIPAYYMAEVKKMWFTIPGLSHAEGYLVGLNLLEALDPNYSVNVTTSGTPEAYTTTHLRASKASSNGWGGWAYGIEEGGWWTNAAGISDMKDSITECNTTGLNIAAIGFGWCWDAIAGSATVGTDPVYGVHWYGESKDSPDGDRAWGLDSADTAVTGNSVSVDTYLSATEEYITHCTNNGYATKVFFTTGAVDIYNGEAGYQGHLKYERIRDYVNANDKILLDFADILCFDDDGTPGTQTWNGHTYPFITDTNVNPTVNEMHISNAGALRLGKAVWWMLARIAGWSGNSHVQISNANITKFNTA